MRTKQAAAAACAAAIGAGLLAGCARGGETADRSVVIWTTEEQHMVEYYRDALESRFPDYEITIDNVSASTIAAKVVEEKEDCVCDIIWSDEYGYLEMCSDYLTELTDFDYSVFLDEIVPASRKYTPQLKNAGCVILNRDIMAERGLPVPASYQDLLNPVYRGLIAMPSPASSGTGYMFLRQLTNEWGEDAAFAYFQQLSENILQYTSSGMGPVNLLIQGETAIGLGMTSQTVTEINEGMPLEIVFFAEGSPYSMYGNALLSGSAEKQAAVDVFRYLTEELVKDGNALFYPEQIFKDFVPSIENYPTDIHYGDMSNDTLAEKERLLEKWTFS